VPRRASIAYDLALAAVAFLCAFCVRSDALPHFHSRLSALPRVTLWAWERYEDLHTLDTHRFAVAYLDRTITIGLIVTNQPRRDTLIIPATISRIPVVRIETLPYVDLSDENRAEAIRQLLEVAAEPGISALQIDFDATRSQRAFYSALLTDLRRQLPAKLPLSITALASWCAADDWLRTLPPEAKPDEAVPMLFRMEPGRHPGDLETYAIREPLCSGSAGLSTTEPWPDNLAGKRLYIFPDNGWQKDSPTDIIRRLP
jgi:hypothetical protein